MARIMLNASPLIQSALGATVGLTLKSGIAAAILSAASLAQAAPADFSFAGTFTRDDDVQLFNFSVGAPSSVTLVSFGYAGGTQANGNVVPRGGFDTILALFNAAGVLVNQNDDSPSATCGPVTVATDPVTGRRYDTCLNAMLAAGNYTVSVMQYANFALGPNLSDGFRHDGAGNFTSAFGCSNGSFCDAAGNNRSNAWAFDVRNVDSAVTVAIPEPSSLALAGMALLGLAVRRKTRRA